MQYLEALFKDIEKVAIKPIRFVEKLGKRKLG